MTIQAPSAWWKYQTGLTVAGGYVTQWDDNQNSHDLLHFAIGRDPAYDTSDGSLVFNGHTNDRLLDTLISGIVTDSAYEGYIVVRPRIDGSNASTYYNAVVWLDRINSGMGLELQNSQWSLWNIGSGLQTAKISWGGAGVIQYLGFRHDAGNIILRNIQTAESATTVSANTYDLTNGRLALGFSNDANNNYDGKIYELIMFNSVLSSGDRAYYDTYILGQGRNQLVQNVTLQKTHGGAGQAEVDGLLAIEYIEY